MVGINLYDLPMKISKFCQYSFITGEKEIIPTILIINFLKERDRTLNLEAYLRKKYLNT
jgi:hypothetical protein